MMIVIIVIMVNGSDGDSNDGTNDDDSSGNGFLNFIILFFRNKSIHTMYRTKHSHSLSKGMRGWTGEVKY